MEKISRNGSGKKSDTTKNQTEEEYTTYNEKD